MILGLFLSFSGMIGEFANPLFIGWVIDAIVDRDMEQVKTYVVWWMTFNSVGAVLTGCQSVIFQIITQKIGQQLRQDVFD